MVRSGLVPLACCGGPHATVDAPAADSFALARQATTVTMRTPTIVVEQVMYVGRSGLVLAGQVCRPNRLPSTWPDPRYLLIFDGVGHEFTSPGGQAMALDLAT